MAATITEVLRAKIDEYEDSLKEAILKGSPTDYDEYRYLTGRLSGFATVKHIIKDLESSLYESEDDD